MLNLPGGALTVPIRSWALRAGFGGTAAIAIGLAGEWALYASIVGVAAWWLDPLDLYEGGIIPDAVAQATTVPVWEALTGQNERGPSYNLDFELSDWGSFQ